MERLVGKGNSRSGEGRGGGGHCQEGSGVGTIAYVELKKEVCWDGIG